MEARNSEAFRIQNSNNSAISCTLHINYHPPIILNETAMPKPLSKTWNIFLKSIKDARQNFKKHSLNGGMHHGPEIIFHLLNWWLDIVSAQHSPLTPLHTSISARHPRNRCINLLTQDSPDNSHLAIKYFSKTHTPSNGTNRGELSANVKTDDHITWKRTMEGDTYATENSWDLSHPVIHIQQKREHGRRKLKDTGEATNSSRRSCRNRQLLWIPPHRNPCTIHGHRSWVDCLHLSNNGDSIHHHTKVLSTVLGSGTSTSSETTQYGAPISTLAQHEHGYPTSTSTPFTCWNVVIHIANGNTSDRDGSPLDNSWGTRNEEPKNKQISLGSIT